MFNNQQEQLQQLQLQNQQLQNEFSSLQNNLASIASAAAVAAIQSLLIPTFSSTSIHPVKGAGPEKFSGDCGDPDDSRTACTKLHNLKMSSSMSADEYTAQFEILAGRTHFNDAALEDAYSRGLSTAILDKIHAQPTLPVDLKAWKEVACQIDRNHRRLLEMERVQPTCTFSRPTPPRTSNNLFTTPPTASAPLSTATPVDIDSSRRRTEDQTCYNCGKQGHISPACPERNRFMQNTLKAPLKT